MVAIGPSTSMRLRAPNSFLEIEGRRGWRLALRSPGGNCAFGLATRDDPLRCGCRRCACCPMETRDNSSRVGDRHLCRARHNEAGRPGSARAEPGSREPGARHRRAGALQTLGKAKSPRNGTKALIYLWLTRTPCRATRVSGLPFHQLPQKSAGVCSKSPGHFNKFRNIEPALAALIFGNERLGAA